MVCLQNVFVAFQDCLHQCVVGTNIVIINFASWNYGYVSLINARPGNGLETNQRTSAGLYPPTQKCPNGCRYLRPAAMSWRELSPRPIKEYDRGDAREGKARAEKM